MQLHRKNNIIINATKHKGTIEEKHSHIETLGLVGDQGKTHYGKPFQILLLIRLSSNDSAKESTLIHIFIHTTIKQN